MTARIDRATQAELIYRQARAEVEQQLWTVALGRQTDSAPVASVTGFRMVPALPLQDQVALAQRPQPAPASRAPVVEARPLQLGSNRKYAGALNRAAQRTGVPATALAAIVNAESGRRPDGGWNTASRNPRSSAAGLGQFLSGTWLAEAERAGSHLNRVVRARGWLDGAGRVAQSARQAVLALRLDAETAIEATADFAAGNLARLKRAGIALGSNAEEVARTAWMSHHLGPAEAVRFLKGALSPDRARQLLEAQIGASAAGQRIAAAGDAVAAHRQWLAAYVTRHVRVPDIL
jgi:hypothetical protein